MYAMLQSSMRDLKVDESLIAKNKNPWWKKTLTGINIGIGVLAGAALVMFVLTTFVFDKEKGQKDEEAVAE